MQIAIVIVSFSVLIFVHELGHFLSAKFCGIKVEKFGLGFPPRLLWIRTRETEYSLNLLPFGGFVKIYGEHAEGPIREKERAFVFQPAWKKSVVLLSGVFMNLLTGWLIMVAVFSVGAPERVLISQIAENSPAAEAGLANGDLLEKAAFGGAAVPLPLTSDKVAELSRVNGGKRADFTIQRAGRIMQFSVPLRVSSPEGEGPLGVSLVDMGFPASPFPENIVEGTKASVESVRLIASSFYALARGLFHEPEIVKSVSGPIGIVAIAAQAGAIGLVYLAQFMALVSLNLAVLNLIPFPALDGGQFLMVLVEKIRGRVFSTRLRVIVNSVGMGLLFLLMILVTIKDLDNIFHR